MLPAPGPADIVVGGGHNGLVAACYLALAGREVLVLEAQAEPGGGSRTAETVPGHRFDLHSAAHNIINMTDIPEELGLADAGLDYLEMDPFSVAVHADGRRVRFHRSEEATLESVAEVSGEDADAYRRFLDLAHPLVSAVMPTIRGQRSLRGAPGQVRDVVVAARRRGVGALVRDVLGPYDALLRRHLASDLTRGPVAAFAAHGGVGPTSPGGALYAFWQAAYHRYGQWHGRGGAANLIDALTARLRALGGELRCSAPVARIEAPHGRVEAVVLDGGERLAAARVITACDVRRALLELLDPPLGDPEGSDLRAARRSNVVQAVLHVATDRLPPYEGGRPGDAHGLQSYVDRLEDLSRAWVRAEAGLLTDPLPLYAFTPSAIDPTLAPAGRHTVYLACPAAPAVVEGGWPAATDPFVDRALATVERRAPGFRASVGAVVAWTPDRMVAEEAWPGAHPMHLDLALDQLGPFRPTPGLGGWRTPVEGLYVSGAGTNPAGGIAGTPGRQAARALLADVGGGRWGRRLRARPGSPG